MATRKPTTEEASANAIVDGCMAVWYPQMGGYCSVAWVAPRGGCFDVAVYHDGEFPFHEDEMPTVLHHCDPRQFIEFGRTVESFLKSNPQAHDEAPGGQFSKVDFA